MQQPPNRLCCPHCGRHPDVYHQIADDDSDDLTSASSISTSSEANESDEEFVECDSEAGHSADDYPDQTATSVGSSEHWNDEGKDDATDSNDNDDVDGDDDDDRDNDEDDTTALLDNHSADVSKVLDRTSMHESSMANLCAVLCSLDTGDASKTQHAPDVRAGDVDASNSQIYDTSKLRVRKV